MGEGGLTAEFVVLQVEDVGVEGLLATRGVLLGVESSAVSLQGGEVLDADCGSLRGLCETGACLEFVSRRSGGAGVRIGVLGVNTLTVGVGGGSGTVGHDEITTVLVTIFLDGFLHCALDILDTSDAYGCFCHSCSALSPNRPPSAVRPLTL